MERVRSFTFVSATTMFTGSQDFLDSQSIFHLIYDYTPTILHLSQQRNNLYATEDTEYLSAKLLAIFHLY